MRYLPSTAPTMSCIPPAGCASAGGPSRWVEVGVVRSPWMPSFQRHVFVCVNERPADDPRGCCKSKGGVEVRDRLKKELKARGIAKIVRANNAGCLDQCARGVSVVVYPEQV